MLIITVTVVSGVIVLGAAGVGDQWVRSQELNSVLSTFEKIHNPVNAFYAAIGPVLDTTNTDSNSPGFTTGQIRLAKVVSEAGSDSYVDLRIVASEMEDLNLLPWHSDLAELKSDFLDNLDARILWADHWAMSNTRVTINPYSTQVDATSQIALLTARGLSIPMFAIEATTRIDNLR
jgi:hypothetical protein